MTIKALSILFDKEQQQLIQEIENFKDNMAEFYPQYFNTSSLFYSLFDPNFRQHFNGLILDKGLTAKGLPFIQFPSIDPHNLDNDNFVGYFSADNEPEIFEKLAKFMGSDKFEFAYDFNDKKQYDFVKEQLKDCNREYFIQYINAFDDWLKKVADAVKLAEQAHLFDIEQASNAGNDSDKAV